MSMLMRTTVFHNNTTPRYNDAAADLAWARTLTFFRTHLAASAKHSRG